MIEGIAVWFLTSKTGRTIAAIGAALVALGIAALTVFNKGKQAERSAQDRRALKSLRKRNKINEDVDRASPGELDRRTDRWVRPSGE